MEEYYSSKLKPVTLKRHSSIGVFHIFKVVQMGTKSRRASHMYFLYICYRIGIGSSAQNDIETKFS